MVSSTSLHTKALPMNMKTWVKQQLFQLRPWFNWVWTLV